MQRTVARPTRQFDTRAASAKTPASASAATASIAVRAVSIWKPKSFHASAIHAITSGGCAFESVECGMNEPSR